MSEYPALPIVIDEATGFEYAKGYNIFRYNTSMWESNKFIGQINSSFSRIRVDDSNTPSTVALKAKCTARNGNNPSGIYFSCTQAATDWYKPKIGVTYSVSVYVKTSRNIIMKVGCESLTDGSSGNFTSTTSWQKITIENKTCFRETGALTFYSDDFQIDDELYISSVMMNIGKTASDYRPNPADLISSGLPMSIVARGNTIDVYNSVSETIQGAVSQAEERLSTSITQTKNEIESTVSQGYYAKSDTDRLIAEASTILTQTYNAFEMTFNEFKQSVEYSETLTNSQFETITKFIRFIEGNIYLGQEGNDQMLKISSNRISFLQGNNEVAYISNSVLYIYDGVFINSLRIQKYAWVPRANGHLSLKKVS